jgi:hypothetical protein
MKEDITKEVLNRVDIIGDKIAVILKVLADKLGTSTEYFWPIFVKQQVIEGITSMGVWFIALVVGIAISLLLFKIYKKDSIQNNYSDWLPPAIIVSVITGFILIIFLIALSYGLPLVLNPEYYALKDILDMVK